MNIGATSKKNDTNIDLLLDGFNLTGGLLALTALNAGINVAIRLNQKPAMGFQPELSFFYPNNFKHSLSALSNYRFLLTHIAEQTTNKKVNTDPHLGQIRSTTTQLIKIASELTGKKLNLKQTLKSLAGEPITFEQFRIIQAECDKQFDMAKQTGISYRHFVQLFYRYRHHIDAMIENAYEMMEKERNPEIIWNHIEKDFIDKEFETIFGALHR